MHEDALFQKGVPMSEAVLRVEKHGDLAVVFSSYGPLAAGFWEKSTTQFTPWGYGVRRLTQAEIDAAREMADHLFEGGSDV